MTSVYTERHMPQHGTDTMQPQVVVPSHHCRPPSKCSGPRLQLLRERASLRNKHQLAYRGWGNSRWRKCLAAAHRLRLRSAVPDWPVLRSSQSKRHVYRTIQYADTVSVRTCSLSFAHCRLYVRDRTVCIGPRLSSSMQSSHAVTGGGGGNGSARIYLLSSAMFINLFSTAYYFASHSSTYFLVPSCTPLEDQVATLYTSTRYLTTSRTVSYFRKKRRKTG